MRKEILHCLTLIAFILFSNISSAQAPAEFNFQGLARNEKGEAIVVKDIALRFTIRTERADGPIAYRESRSVLTDSSGVFNAVIGGAGAKDATGSLSAVIWKTGSKFLQVEIDTANGITFKDLGATQLLSVPFAMFSNNANYADSSRHADTARYARSAGAYFFEAVFPDVFPDGYLEVFPGVIKFPLTNYNHVNATGQPVYDTTTGVFTAPEAGIYQFDIKVGDHNDDQFYLTRNAIRIRQIWTGEGNEGFSRRVYLDAGDRVSVYLADEAGYQLEDGEPTNYFSGYKIY